MRMTDSLTLHARDPYYIFERSFPQGSRTAQPGQSAAKWDSCWVCVTRISGKFYLIYFRGKEIIEMFNHLDRLFDILVATQAMPGFARRYLEVRSCAFVMA